jgi:hypothetical protein
MGQQKRLLTYEQTDSTAVPRYGRTQVPLPEPMPSSPSGYCPFAPKWQVVFVDPLPSNLHTEGNFQARFSRRKSIVIPNPYRLTSSFFALRKYLDV